MHNVSSLELIVVIEKGVDKAPVFSAHLPPHNGSRLRSLTASSDRQILILGARRTPPVRSPKPNSDSAIATCTSVGFRELKTSDYVRAGKEIGADIIIGLGDISHGEKHGLRRREKMMGRTERWTKELAEAVQNIEQDDSEMRRPALFAPVLPVEIDQQRWYMDLLTDEVQGSVAGLALYNRYSAVDLPESLVDLPRLSLTEASDPHQLLQEVEHGTDLLTAPFVGQATDAGIALMFHFPAPAASERRRALGMDMWGAAHAKSKEPLLAGCECYACQRHTRAYLRHLLDAKEMLAWVLLQIHNVHIMHAFFDGVRISISEGRFAVDHSGFQDAYEADLPAKTGAGPRLRGYQTKSEGPNEPKINAPAFAAPAARTAVDDG